ncbi:hypothetical protein AMTR_s00013p00093400 [Amborella trichopoda]|uniref:Uncharacterized protein n=1 Tax=Amborella trichopoda TaxID=13333 RepID=W1PRJ1_AMBTC|nr:hypothetical protein AMTR_s00013p00093400 [Amborella trichopoda]
MQENIIKCEFGSLWTYPSQLDGMHVALMDHVGPIDDRLHVHVVFDMGSSWTWNPHHSPKNLLFQVGQMMCRPSKERESGVRKYGGHLHASVIKYFQYCDSARVQQHYFMLKYG